jgi:signal-transduction protein with cAMP-binding, CBS, and nucleotidyltransferase domain
MKINEMAEGQAFGELALINDAPRMATVVTHTASVFAVLLKRDFTNIMKSIQEMKLYEEMSKIQKVAGLHSVSRRALNMFIYSFASKNFNIREFVYQEGQPTEDLLFVVRSG